MRLFSSLISAVVVIVGVLTSGGCSDSAKSDEKGNNSNQGKLAVKSDDKNEAKGELATFGAGCFWCVEAVFEELEGVLSVDSGYTGGKVANPTYQQVCSGTTGHAEVCQVRFDPNKISYDELLEVFWQTHDPTTLNRQGADAGTQYRSVIFFHNDKQKELAEKYKKELDKSGAFKDRVVTEISPAEKYYSAEEDHQNFFSLNPNQGYCRAVIVPKMEKFRKVFKDKLKKK